MTRDNVAPRVFRLGPLPILAAAIATLYFAREILIPLAFALTLTLILSPAVGWLHKIHVSRTPAVLIVIVLTGVTAGGLAWIMGNQLIEAANELPNYRENIHRKIEAMHTPTKGALGRAAASVQEISKELTGAESSTAGHPDRSARRGASTQPARPLPVEVVEPPRNGLLDARDFIKAVIAPLGITGIVLIFTVFMLAKKEDLRNRLLRLVGLGQLNVMTQALDDATQRVSRYLLMQFVVNAAFGLLFGIALYFIGVPYAVLWGTIAALLRLVPYLGALVAGMLPFAISLAVFDTWAQPLLVLGVCACLELITGNVIEPWLYGAHTGISALAILVAAVFWTVLWGPAGLILSTPLTVCLLVLGRYVPQLSFLHILLGDEPVLEPDARLYQRLLAMDQSEARSVADAYLKEHALIELYDLVMIPALTMAEQDRHRGSIDASREEFLFLSLNEMIADFSEQQPDLAIESPQRTGRIFCVPAYDQADEVTAAMLAHLLEQRGDAALSFPFGPGVNDMIALLDPGPDDVICISTLPPYALAPARKMCKQVRARFPKVEVIVGVWGYSEDQEKAKASFERSQPNQFFTTFAQVMEHFHPLMPEPNEPEPTLVETS
jgi:predicted PurR-regulated permease PerM